MVFWLNIPVNPVGLEIGHQLNVVAGPGGFEQPAGDHVSASTKLIRLPPVWLKARRRSAVVLLGTGPGGADPMGVLGFWFNST
jgi:hypothetical protein